ncbi:MAG: hypothetical protein GXZ02_01245 [Clostridiales bacterium]|nr:hypothetical protein [Clostridiales bacterium]
MLLFFLVSIPLSIGSILSAIPTRHCCLDDHEHTQFLDELNMRRQAEEDMQSPNNNVGKE